MNIRLLSLIAGAVALSACGSGDKDWFNTGRDARAYNPQTGRYEWPDEDPAPRRAKPPQPIDPAAGAPEERAFDPKKRAFE